MSPSFRGSWPLVSDVLKSVSSPLLTEDRELCLVSISLTYSAPVIKGVECVIEHKLQNWYLRDILITMVRNKFNHFVTRKKNAQ